MRVTNRPRRGVSGGGGGLFSPVDPVDELRRIKELEAAQRAKEAMESASLGGFQAQQAAKYNQMGIDALSTIGEGLTGAIKRSRFLGEELTERFDEGSRLDLAMEKRLFKEKMKLKYKEASADGVITKKEYAAIAADMEAAGYHAEAAQVRSDASKEYGTAFQQEELEVKRAEAAARKAYRNRPLKPMISGSGTTVTMSEEEAINLGLKGEGTYQALHEYDNNLKKWVTRYLPVEGTPTSLSKLGPEGAADKEGAIALAQHIVIRNTEKFKNKLKIGAARIQKDLNISEDAAKKYADWGLSTRKRNIESGNVAAANINKVKSMLGYLNDLEKAGKNQGDIQATLNKWKRNFGIEAKDDATFRTLAQKILLDDLKELMGLRPTDIDLQEMAKTYPNEKQPISANRSILRRILQRYNDEMFAGDFYRKNKNAGPEDFANAVRERYKNLGSYEQPLKLPKSMKSFDDWYDSLPSGACALVPSKELTTQGLPNQRTVSCKP